MTPDGGKTFTYDNMGRLTTTTDANSRVKENFYDALGRLVSQEDQLDNATTFGYDIAGRQISTTDANGNMTAYEYNGDGQRTKITYPVVTGQPANEGSYSYNGNGQLSSKTTPNGNVIAYTYNAAGLLASEAGVAYSYDSAGDITNDGVMSYTYDQFGRKETATDLNTGKVITYANDKRSLPITTQVADLMTVTQTYDDAGRLKTVKKDSDAAATYHYDSGGRRTSLALPNGQTTAYSYDTNDRVTGIEVKDSADAVLAKHVYTLDATGVPSAVAQDLRVWENNQWVLKSSTIAYGMDNAYRLTSEVRTEDQTETYREEFTYDDVGNRTQRIKNGVTTSYSHNARNQLVSSVTGGVTTGYTYDKSGNMLSSSDGSVTKTMVYDVLNRMTSWTDGTSSESTTYIGAKWHRSSYTTGGATTHFMYSGDNVIADLVDDPLNPGSYLGDRLYVTPFLDENLSMTILSGTAAGTYYYSQDRRSTVLTLTDSTSTMVNTYDHSAMGERLASTIENVPQRYTYTGRELNATSNEMYFRYRTYGPAMGQFFTRDPLGYEDRPSLYQGHFTLGLGLDPLGLSDAATWGELAGYSHEIAAGGGMGLGAVAPPLLIIVAGTLATVAVYEASDARAETRLASTSAAAVYQPATLFHHSIADEMIPEWPQMPDFRKLKPKKTLCQILYLGYKRLCKKGGCMTATNCRDLYAALHAKNACSAARLAYMKMGCDKFDWNNVGNTAADRWTKHASAWTQSWKAYRNCLKRWFALGCAGCPTVTPANPTR